MSNNRPIKEVCFGSDVPVAFSLEGVSDDISLKDCFVRAEAYAGGKSVSFEPTAIVQISEKELLLPVKTSQLERGELWIKVEVHLPDQNFGTNYRTEILRGFTYIKIV
ncbi:MAG: hypothetical protein IKA34_01470 [Bacteroidales bacterium]|nr:hypothetical protein [Bacteroidales bacterium]